MSDFMRLALGPKEDRVENAYLMACVILALGLFILFN